MASQAAAPLPAVTHTDACVPELARTYYVRGSDGTIGLWCSFCQAHLTVFSVTCRFPLRRGRDERERARQPRRPGAPQAPGNDTTPRTLRRMDGTGSSGLLQVPGCPASVRAHRSR